MIKIAICDDQPEFVAELTKRISQFCNYEISTFTEPIALYSAYQRKQFSIVFLDIDMPAITGFELAEGLRKINPFVIIIFVTCQDHLITSSFSFRPLGFIRKDHLDEEIQHIFPLIDKELLLMNPLLIIESERKTYKIEVKQIVYIQSSKNYIECTFTNDRQRYRTTLKAILPSLTQFKFLQINRGVYINVNYLKNVNYKEKVVELTTGEKLPLSRACLYAFRKKIGD